MRALTALMLVLAAHPAAALSPTKAMVAEATGSKFAVLVYVRGWRWWVLP